MVFSTPDVAVAISNPLGDNDISATKTCNFEDYERASPGFNLVKDFVTHQEEGKWNMHGCTLTLL
eukprot:5443583-Prorocentrum_lima.AAC.1